MTEQEKVLKSGIEHLMEAIGTLSLHEDSSVQAAVADLTEILSELCESIGKSPIKAPASKAPPPKPTKKTTKCSRCGEMIYFAPHPMNPDKLAPFNVSDDEIHFAKCGGKNADVREYRNKEDLRQYLAEKNPGRSARCLNNFHVHWATKVSGDLFLRVTCACHGSNLDILPQSVANIALIDKEKDWHKILARKMYPYKNEY